MRWNYYKGMMGGTVVAFCLLCMASTKMVCASGKEANTYALEKIRYTNDGGSTDLYMNEREELEVTINTKSVDAGYYTSFLYCEEDNKLKEGQTIALSLSTKKELSMNINLIDEKGTAYVGESETQLYLKEDGTDTFQRASIENGTFLVPKDFQGEVCIPVDGVVAKKELEKVTTLSFIFVEKEGQESFFVIKELQVLGKSDKVSLLAAKGYQIIGADNVVIPSVGESMYQYHIASKEGTLEEAKIRLQEEAEGITLSADGFLTVSETAKPQTLHLIATMPEGSRVELPLVLESFAYAKLEEVPLDLIVPTKGEVAQYKDGLDHKKKAEAIDFALRMTLIFAMAGYLVFYSKKIRQK